MSNPGTPNAPTIQVPTRQAITQEGALVDRAWWSFFQQVAQVLNLNTTGFVTVDSPQTLTKKTIDGGENTLTNIPNSSLTNDQISINGQEVELGGEVNISTTGAFGQNTVPAPVAPASISSFTMQGLAGKIVPQKSGTVLLIISGSITSASGAAGDGIVYKLSIGTGPAPANGDPAAGTVLGTTQQYLNPTALTAADVSVPFSIQAVATGLDLNIPYWLDLVAEAQGTASDTSLVNVSVSAVEL